MVQITKLVPPDGGYGWMIAGAYALHHFLIVSLFQGFGIMFKDKFKDLGLLQKDISFIMATNSAFAMFIGIFLGPLLKYLGYRKVAFIGATCMTFGLLLTAFGNSFAYFLVTYGFIASVGRGVGLAAYPVALNSYFSKKRSKAAGYAMTVFGLGPVIMPHVYSLLIEYYGVIGGAMIVAAFTGHTYASSMLLQPVKRYMKTEVIEENETEKGKLLKANDKDTENITLNDKEVDVNLISTMESHLDESRLSLCSEVTLRSLSISSRKSTMSRTKSKQTEEKNSNEAKETKDDIKAEGSSTLLKEIGKRIVDIFDLTLLRDLTYVNIAMGMSLSFFSEQNFVLLTPFIAQDYGLNTQQIATFISIISALDICFRFLSPYVIDFFKQPVRIMYMWSLIVPILSKFSLLFAGSYTSLLCCAVFLGTARGLRVVYFQLLIPSHVPIERLGAAIGLQNTLSSIFICIGGPLLGLIKDVTGSFAACIFVLNAVTFLSILTWTVELLYKRHKSKTSSKEVEADLS